jgi:formylmethanofuran dehydrogenase subunit B
VPGGPGKNGLSASHTVTVKEFTRKVVNQFANLPLLPSVLALVEIHGVTSAVQELANRASTTIYPLHA